MALDMEKIARWYELTTSQAWGELEDSRDTKSLRAVKQAFEQKYGKITESEAMYVRIKKQLPTIKDESERQKLVGYMTALEMEPAAQMMAGIGGVLTGAGHRLQEMGIMPRITSQEEMDQQAEYRAGLEQTRGGSLGNLMGQALPAAALPSGRNMSFIPRMLQQAAMNVGLESLNKPAPSEDNPVLRYGVAAAAPMGFEAASSGVVKGISAIRGITGKDQVLNNFMKIAEKHNITNYGFVDLPGQASKRWVTNRVARIPIIGDRARAAKLSDELDLATQRIINKYLGDFRVNPDLVRDVDPTFRQRMEAIAQSLREVYDQRMRVQAHKYDMLDNVIKKYRITDNVELTNFQPQLRRLLRENELLLFDQRMPTTLRDQLLEISNLTIEPTTGRIQTMPKKLRGDQPATVKFKDIQNINRALNDLYGRILTDPRYKGLTGQIRALKAAMWADTDEWANRGIKSSQKQEAIRLWEDARKWYQEKIAPIDDEGPGYLYKVIKGDVDIDNIIRSYLKGDRYSKADLLMDSLTLQGKDLIRGQFLMDAYTHAMRGGLFSPKAFSAFLDKQKVIMNEIFTKEQQKELIGLKMLMIQMDASLDVLRKGVDVGVSTALGGVSMVFAFKNLPVTATLLGSMTAISKLLTTRAGRRILTAASEIPLNDKPAFDMLLGKANNVIAAGFRTSVNRLLEEDHRLGNKTEHIQPGHITKEPM